MSTLLQIPPEKPTSPRRFRRPAILGVTALVCGILSVLGAVIHSLWGPFSPAPSLSEQILGNVSGVTQAVLSSLTGATRAEPPLRDATNLDTAIKQAIVLLSVVGMLTAIVAYIRRENRRLVGSALVMSGMAFATQYLLFPLVGIGVVALLILVAAVL